VAESGEEESEISLRCAVDEVNRLEPAQRRVACPLPLGDPHCLSGPRCLGLASAAVVRALAGSMLMAIPSLFPTLMAPRLVRGTLRSMLAFGVGIQAVGVAGLART
jgi:hypothetical protein